MFTEKDPVRGEDQQHERLLELSRRLRAVVRELGRYAHEERGSEEHAIDAPAGHGQAQDARPPLGPARVAVLGGDFPLEQAGDEAVPRAPRADGRTPEELQARAGRGEQSLAGTRSSRILLNAGFRAIADIGSKIATAALYIFVARKLGASQFGIYMFALSFVGVGGLSHHTLLVVLLLGLGFSLLGHRLFVRPDQSHRHSEPLDR